MKLPIKINPARKPLTLNRSRSVLLLTPIWTLGFAWLGLDNLAHGDKIQGAFLCLGALSQIFSIPFLWNRHQSIKQGQTVYVPTADSALVPKIISILVCGVLTLLITICSALGIVATYTQINTFFGWTICGAILSAVWLAIGYVWYRILTEKLVTKPIPFQEQPAGVWPPPPSISLSSDSKD